MYIMIAASISSIICSQICIFFFFNATATTEIYTLSLHDALPILQPAEDIGGLRGHGKHAERPAALLPRDFLFFSPAFSRSRSEEHTSELQSRLHLVCRLLLEKKKKNQNKHFILVRHIL